MMNMNLARNRQVSLIVIREEVIPDFDKVSSRRAFEIIQLKKKPNRSIYYVCACVSPAQQKKSYTYLLKYHHHRFFFFNDYFYDVCIIFDWKTFSVFQLLWRAYDPEVLMIDVRVRASMVYCFLFPYFPCYTLICYHFNSITFYTTIYLLSLLAIYSFHSTNMLSH